MAVKRKASDADAHKAAVLIKQIDYQLMGLVRGPNCPLTLAASERLVRMQRALRDLRYDIEVERRFDTPALDVPRPWEGGGPKLRAVHGDRRGEASA